MSFPIPDPNKFFEIYMPPKSLFIATAGLGVITYFLSDFSRSTEIESAYIDMIERNGVHIKEDDSTLRGSKALDSYRAIGPISFLNKRKLKADLKKRYGV